MCGTKWRHNSSLPPLPPVTAAVAEADAEAEDEAAAVGAGFVVGGDGDSGAAFRLLPLIWRFGAIGRLTETPPRKKKGNTMRREMGSIRKRKENRSKQKKKKKARHSKSNAEA